jgi:hypothetical protein
MVLEFVAWFESCGSPVLRLPVVVMEGGTPELDLGTVTSQEPVPGQGNLPSGAQGGNGAAFESAPETLDTVEVGPGAQIGKIEMYGLPEPEVTALLKTCGLSIVSVAPLGDLDGWDNRRYIAINSASEA